MFSSITADDALALSKKYTKNSLKGLGALKGAPCQVESIEPVSEGTKVTLKWVGNDGTTQTGSFIVEGTKPIEITQAEYDALSDAEKNDPSKVYYIIDGSTYSLIDDSIISNEQTWSSKKINDGIKESVEEAFEEHKSEFVGVTDLDGETIYKGADNKIHAVGGGDSEKADATIQKNISSINLLTIPDTEPMTLNGITVSAKDGVITLNGTSTNTVYLKITNGLELATTVPTKWTTESAPIVAGQRYSLFVKQISGTFDFNIASSTSIVMSARNSSKTSLWSAKEGSGVPSSNGAYIQFYLYNDCTLDNFKFIPVLTTDEVFKTYRSEYVLKDIYKDYVSSISSKSFADITPSAFYAVQGIAYHDGYLYVTYIPTDDSTGSLNVQAYIDKINVATKTVVKTATNLPLYHANGITYCDADGYLHVVKLYEKGVVCRITTDLELVDTYTINLDDKYSDYLSVRQIAYNAKRDELIFTLKRNAIQTIAIFDGKRNFKRAFDIYTKGLMVNKGITCDDDFIYTMNAKHNILVYSYNGTYIGECFMPLQQCKEYEDITTDGTKFYVTATKAYRSNYAIYESTVFAKENACIVEL